MLPRTLGGSGEPIGRPGVERTVRLAELPAIECSKIELIADDLVELYGA